MRKYTTILVFQPQHVWKESWYESSVFYLPLNLAPVRVPCLTHRLAPLSSSTRITDIPVSHVAVQKDECCGRTYGGKQWWLLLWRASVRRRFIDGWKTSNVRTPQVLEKSDTGSVVLREVGKTLVTDSTGADQSGQRRWRPKRRLMLRVGITAIGGDITEVKTTNSKG